MDYPVIGCAVVCIDVEIEPAHCEYGAVSGHRVRTGSGPGACGGEYDVATAGLHESGAIVLCHERQRAIVGQSHPVHPKRIRPTERDRASVSVEDVKRRILSYRIANNSRNRRAVKRRGNITGTGWQIRITDWIWERPVRCTVAGGPETMLPKVVARCIRLHKAAAIGAFGGSDAGVSAVEGREAPSRGAVARDCMYGQVGTAKKPGSPNIVGVDRHAIGDRVRVVVMPKRGPQRSRYAAI